MFRLIPRPIIGALGLMVAMFLPGCGKQLNRSDCEALLLHYTDLLAHSDRPDATTLERLRFREQAREKAAHDPEVPKCEQTVNRRQFDCAMAAPSTDEFERCLM